MIHSVMIQVSNPLIFSRLWIVALCTGLVVFVSFWKLPGPLYSLHMTESFHRDPVKAVEDDRKVSLNEGTCENLWDYGAEEVRDGVKEWRPFDCDLVNYRANTSYLETCAAKLPLLSNRKSIFILFIGDSRMRQLQTALFRELTGRINQLEFTSNDDYCDKKEAANLTWYSEILQTCLFNRSLDNLNFKIERWWTPFFQPAMVQTDLDRILHLPKSEAPSVVFINAGLWLIRDCGQKKTPFEECIKNYTRNLETLRPDLLRLADRSTVVWVPQTNLSPCQEWSDWGANTKINIFNDLATRIFAGTKVKIWRSVYQIFDFLGSNGDSQHAGEAALRIDTQIILNYLCNTVTQSRDTVCCGKR